MRQKSSTLDDLEGQYCNRNCVGCSTCSLATAGHSCCHIILQTSSYKNSLMHITVWLDYLTVSVSNSTIMRLRVWILAIIH